MKVRGVWVMLAVLVAVGFFAARAWAPGEGAGPEKPRGEAAHAMPGEGAGAEKAKGEAAQAKPAEGETVCPFCGQMMKPEGMKMTGPMRMRHRMMMNERLSAKDPSSILALREELKLTEGQVKHLERIETRAHKEAEDVLTKEQRETLSAVPEHSAWMRQMRERMMGRPGGAAREGAGPR